MTFKNEAEFREHIQRLMEGQMKRANDPGLIVDVPYSPNFAPHMYKRIENGDWYEWLIGAERWSFRISDSELLEAVYQAGKESQPQCFYCKIELPSIIRLPVSQGSPICVDGKACAERVAAQAEAKRKLSEKEKTE